jgi:hypothetical protein
LFAVFAMQLGGVAAGFALGWALGIFALPANSADDLVPDRAVGVRGVDRSATEADRDAVLGAPAGEGGPLITGTDAADELSPGPGPSTIELGAGDDVVNLAVDRARDVVYCGAGEDVVVQLAAADPLDEFFDCEQYAELVAQP